MEGMETWQGTLAKMFNEKIGELEPLMQSPSQLPALKSKVISMIQNADLKKEEDRQRAITIFERIRNYSLFLSTLATYMTGMKVSWRDN